MAWIAGCCKCGRGRSCRGSGFRRDAVGGQEGLLDRAPGRAGSAQIRSMKSENLFPRFTTMRQIVDGKTAFRYPPMPTIPCRFRTGLQRVRMTIRYSKYKRFGADSVIKFDKP